MSEKRGKGTIEDILGQAEAKKYGLKGLIVEVLTSEVFRSR